MRRFRGVFRVFTIVLFLVTAWAVYANVMSDIEPGTDEQAREAAACKEPCRVRSVAIDRGMLGTTFSYAVDGEDLRVVVCRRAMIVAGEWTCARSR